MDVSAGLTIINNFGFSDTDDTTKMAFINDALWKIGGREKWPYLLKSTNLTFDGVSPTPTNMPADFKGVKWIVNTSTKDSVWPERIETIRSKYGSNLLDGGNPAVFYFVGQQLRFWPVPPASSTVMLMDYRAWQQPLTTASLDADILLPTRHHMAWIYGALMALYNMDDDPELAKVKQGELEERIAIMKEDLFGQQEVRADRIYTLDPDEMITDQPFWLP